VSRRFLISIIVILLMSCQSGDDRPGGTSISKQPSDITRVTTLSAPQKPCLCPSLEPDYERLAEAVISKLDHQELARLLSPFLESVCTAPEVGKADEKPSSGPSHDASKPTVPVDETSGSKDNPETLTRDEMAVDDVLWRVELDGHEPQFGGAFAPVTIVMWSAPRCALCRRQLQLLRKAVEYYGDRLRVVWKNAPAVSDEGSESFARSACAAHRQNTFWPFLDEVSLLPADSKDSYRVIAVRNGMDGERFKTESKDETCLHRAQLDLNSAGRVGAVTVPSVFVNGRRTRGVLPFDVLKNVIDEELAKAAALEVSGVGADRLYQVIIEEGELFSPIGEEPVEFLSAGELRGSPDAPIRVTVFGDYECPYSAALELTLKELEGVYKDQLAVDFRPFPLPFHPTAAKAARAALAAAEQEAFWKVHSGLFKLNGKLNSVALQRVVRKTRLDYKKWQDTVESEHIADRLREITEEGRSLGVETTPTIFINGYQYLGQDRSLKTLSDMITVVSGRRQFL
jgi:protein-disulfide isomerase